MLKNDLVCGYRDISKENYAGFSGSHKVGEQAIRTTNGAGPHNVQSFILASDGTVMHCLPGYWNPADLAREVEFASRLHDVWTNPKLSSTQKNQYFGKMHMAHINEHPQHMKMRSRMQSFDMEHEVKNNFSTSDTILDRGWARNILSQDRNVKFRAMQAFKTTDQIMHERMARRPFVAYSKFDVAKYAEYGRPLYDKSENFRNENGQFVDNGRVVERPPSKVRDQELVGKVPEHIRRRRDPNFRFRRGGNLTSFNNNNDRNIAGRNSAGGNSRLWGQSNNSKSGKVLWGAN